MSNPKLPGDVEAVCLLCAQRFRTMNGYVQHRFDPLYVRAGGCFIRTATRANSSHPLTAAVRGKV